MLQASGAVLLPTFLPEPLEGPREVRVAPPPVPAPVVEAFIRERLETNLSDVYAETHLWLDRILLPLVLEHTDGVQCQAASLLGIGRQTLRQRLRELGLASTPSADQAEEDGE